MDSRYLYTPAPGSTEGTVEGYNAQSRSQISNCHQIAISLEITHSHDESQNVGSATTGPLPTTLPISLAATMAPPPAPSFGPSYTIPTSFGLVPSPGLDLGLTSGVGLGFAAELEAAPMPSLSFGIDHGFDFDLGAVIPGVPAFQQPPPSNSELGFGNGLNDGVGLSLDQSSGLEPPPSPEFDLSLPSGTELDLGLSLDHGLASDVGVGLAADSGAAPSTDLSFGIGHGFDFNLGPGFPPAPSQGSEEAPICEPAPASLIDWAPSSIFQPALFPTPGNAPASFSEQATRSRLEQFPASLFEQAALSTFQPALSPAPEQAPASLFEPAPSSGNPASAFPGIYPQDIGLAPSTGLERPVSHEQLASQTLGLVVIPGLGPAPVSGSQFSVGPRMHPSLNLGMGTNPASGMEPRPPPNPLPVPTRPFAPPPPRGQVVPGTPIWAPELANLPPGTTIDEAMAERVGLWLPKKRRKRGRPKKVRKAEERLVTGPRPNAGPVVVCEEGELFNVFGPVMGKRGAFWTIGRS